MPNKRYKKGPVAAGANYLIGALETELIQKTHAGKQRALKKGLW